MKLIAHKGNINGPISNKENRPDYIPHKNRSNFDCQTAALSGLI